MVGTLHDVAAHRYFPMLVAVLAAGNWAVLWFAASETGLWSLPTFVGGVVVALALAVQIEAIYKHPEQYPEVVRRVE